MMMMAFWPRQLRRRGRSSLSVVMVVLYRERDERTISEMYCGDILLKNLKMFTYIHCADKFIYARIGLLVWTQTVPNTFILGHLNLPWQSFV